MNKRIWKGIVILLGVYLIYNGAAVFYAAMNGEMSSPVAFIMIGAVFMVYGFVTVCFNAKELFRMIKGTKESQVPPAQEEEQEQTEMKPDSNSGGVVPISERKPRKGPVMAEVTAPREEDTQEIVLLKEDGEEIPEESDGSEEDVEEQHDDKEDDSEEVDGEEVDNVEDDDEEQYDDREDNEDDEEDDKAISAAIAALSGTLEEKDEEE